ncbi:WGR domain-containing protein [Neiella marina]|uniref:WGR domain-containing protein n=1 Tax=Neiella holothuriorum TaxID=2870530 RepID=A0ABS7EG76_9GAMM|nr:WGR domain-containing protein [Neiella holothuriorum]MBW8191320.1 WGR domain-containing protein [Neiella holothuriorum]
MNLRTYYTLLMFQNPAENKDKFYEVTINSSYKDGIENHTVTTCYGRRGSAGTTNNIGDFGLLSAAVAKAKAATSKKLNSKRDRYELESSNDQTSQWNTERQKVAEQEQQKSQAAKRDALASSLQRTALIAMSRPTGANLVEFAYLDDDELVVCCKADSNGVALGMFDLCEIVSDENVLKVVSNSGDYTTMKVNVSKPEWLSADRCSQ